MTDPDLKAFLADARRHLDRELAASGAAPDLAASVARAREIDPAAVPAQAVSEVASLAPVAQLRPHTPRSSPVRESMSDRSALAPFTAALRGHIEADLARRIHRGAVLSASGPDPAVPPVAAREAAVDLASRRRPVIAGALALAAAVLLTLGLRGAFEASQARPGALPGAAALAARANASAGGVAHPREAVRSIAGAPVPEDRAALEPVPQDSPAVAPEPVPQDSSDAAPEPVPQDSPDAAPEPVPQDSPKPPRTRRPARDAAPGLPPAAAPAEDPLTALDREAQALWRAGDLRGATDKFAEIVRRAPGSRAAETAYGDIFALEHQLGNDPVAPWRAYLRQFPRGRYADDARAGICRRAPADERTDCWRAYLGAHPDGAHRREAEQATPPAARQ